MSDRERILAARAAILEQGLSYAQMVEQKFTRAEMQAAITGHTQLGVMPMQLSSLTRLYYNGDRQSFFAGSKTDQGDDTRYRLSIRASNLLRTSLQQFVKESDDKTIMASLSEGGMLYSIVNGGPKGRDFIADTLPIESVLRVRNIIDTNGSYFSALFRERSEWLRRVMNDRIQQHIREQIQRGKMTVQALGAAGFSEADIKEAQTHLIEEYLKPKIAAGELTNEMIAAAGFTQEHIDHARSLYLKDATEEVLRLAASGDEADRKRAYRYANEVAVRAARMGASPQEISRFLGEDSNWRTVGWLLRADPAKLNAELRSLPTDFMGPRIRNTMQSEAYTAVLSRVLSDTTLTTENFAEKMRAEGFDMGVIQRPAVPTKFDEMMLSSTFLGSVAQVTQIRASLGYDIDGVWKHAPLVQRIAANLDAADAIRLRALSAGHPHIHQVAQRRVIEALSREALEGNREALDPEWKVFPGITDQDKAAVRMEFLKDQAHRLIVGTDIGLRTRQAIDVAQRALIMGAQPDELDKYLRTLPIDLRQAAMQSIEHWPQTQALTAFLGKEPVTAEGLTALLQTKAFKDLSSYQLAQLPATMQGTGNLRALLQAATEDRDEASDARLGDLEAATQQALLREIRHQLASGEEGASKRIIAEMTPEHLEAAITQASLDELQDIKRHIPPAPAEGEDPYARWRTVSSDLLHRWLAAKIAEAAAKGPEAVQALLNDSGEFRNIRYGDIEAAMGCLNGDQAQQVLAQLPAAPAAVQESYRNALTARIEAVNQHVAQLREQLVAFDRDGAEVNGDAMANLATLIKSAQAAGVSNRAIGELLEGLPSSRRIFSSLEHGTPQDLALLRQVAKPDSALFSNVADSLRDAMARAVHITPRDDVLAAWKGFAFASPADRAVARVAYLKAQAERLQTLSFSEDLSHREAIAVAQKAVIMGATADELKPFLDGLPPALRTVAQYAAADWPRTQRLLTYLNIEAMDPTQFHNQLMHDDAFNALTAEELRRLPQMLLSADRLDQLAALTAEGTPHRANALIQTLYMNSQQALTTEIRAALMSGDATQIAEAQGRIPVGEGELQRVVQGLSLEDVVLLNAGLPAVPETGDDPFGGLRSASTAHLHSQIATRIAQLSDAGPRLLADMQRHQALFASLKPDDVKAGLGKLTVDQAERLQMQLAAIPASMRDRVPPALLQHRQFLAERVAAAQAQIATLQTRVAELIATHAAVEKNEINFPLEEIGIKGEALLTAIQAAKDAGFSDARIRQTLAALTERQWNDMGPIAHTGFPTLAGVFPDSYRLAQARNVKEQVAVFATAEIDNQTDAAVRLLSSMDEARWAGVSLEQMKADIAGLSDAQRQMLGNGAYASFSQLASILPAPSESVVAKVVQQRLRQQVVERVDALARAAAEPSARTALIEPLLHSLKAAKEGGVADEPLRAALARLPADRVRQLGQTAHAQFPMLAGAFPPAYRTALAASLKDKVDAYVASSGDATAEPLAALVAVLKEAQWAGVRTEQIRREITRLPEVHRQALDQVAAERAPELASMLAAPATVRPWLPQQVAIYRQLFDDYLQRTADAGLDAARERTAAGDLDIQNDFGRILQWNLAIAKGKKAELAAQILREKPYETRELTAEEQKALHEMVMQVRQETRAGRVSQLVFSELSASAVFAREAEQGLGIPASVFGLAPYLPKEEDFALPAHPRDAVWEAAHREFYTQAWQQERERMLSERAAARLEVARDIRERERTGIKWAIEGGHTADLAEAALKKIREAKAAGTAVQLTELEQRSVRYMIDHVRHVVDRLSKGAVPNGMDPYEYAFHGLQIDPALVGIKDPQPPEVIADIDRDSAPDGLSIDPRRYEGKLPEVGMREPATRHSRLPERGPSWPFTLRAEIDPRLQPVAGTRTVVADTFRRILADPRVAGIGWTQEVTPITFRSEAVAQRAQAFLVGIGTPPEKAAEAVRDKPLDVGTDVADASSARIKAGQTDARKEPAAQGQSVKQA